MSEKTEKVTSQFTINSMVVTKFSLSFFLHDGLKSQQGTLQLFWNKIEFEGFTIDFKSNKWLLWSKCLELDEKKRAFPFPIEKSRPDRNNKGFTLFTRGRKGNFCQLPVETAGNRYLRSILPAAAIIFTCGTVYLRPSQVFLHAPILQCRWIGLVLISRD